MQANAIAFVDYVIAKFSFRIREIRTDNGHEFQAKLHWQVEDQGCPKGHEGRARLEQMAGVTRSQVSVMTRINRHGCEDRNVGLPCSRPI
jgi:hypothetical protein